MPMVGIAERLAGSVGSKQTVITGTGKIIQFYSNFTKDPQNPTYDSNFVDPNHINDSEYVRRTAVVENLIVDGQGQGGTTGLSLRNLGGAFIRNITIRNCDVGIHLHNAKGAWTEINHLQHIRMENVKTGILFSTDGPSSAKPGDYPGDSFGHSYIDDVSIELRNIAGAVGIQLGDDSNAPANKVVKPYFSFIKADVWFGSADSCGVKLVNGEIKHCLVNIGVHGKGAGAGVGLDLTNTFTSSAPLIDKNQYAKVSSDIDGFVLRTENLKNSVEKGKYSYNANVKELSF